MKLEKKKNLVARTFNIGKNRIIFNVERLSELKEAITKQDVKDLQKTGAIHIKEIKGRRKLEKRKTRRRMGSVRKNINTRKKDYIILTRKLRAYLLNLKSRNKIPREKFAQIRNEIRASNFRSLSHMKEKIFKLDKETK